MTATDLTATALAAIPGHTKLTDALARIADRRAQLAVGRDAAADRRALIRETADLLAAGKPIPADLGQRRLDIDNAPRLPGAEVEVLNAVADTLRGQLAALEQTDADTALAVVAAELDQVLAEVRTIDTALGSVTTPAAAVNADKAEEWRTLDTLLARYQQVRRTQSRIVRAALDPAGSDLQRVHQLIETVGTLRNYADLDPARALREDNRHAPPSWPSDPAAHLRWIAGPTADPWVPTIAQLEAAHRDLMRRAADAQQDRAAAKGLALSAAAHHAALARANR